MLEIWRGRNTTSDEEGLDYWTVGDVGVFHFAIKNDNGVWGWKSSVSAAGSLLFKYRNVPFDAAWLQVTGPTEQNTVATMTGYTLLELENYTG